MTSPEKLIRTVEINDGLELKIFDASRTVAGDRWQMCVIARIDIPVVYDPFIYLGVDPEQFREFETSVKRWVQFEKKLVRNFIDGKSKRAVLELMIESFLNDSLAYLSHSDFSRKFVLKRFNEYMKKKMWVGVS